MLHEHVNELLREILTDPWVTRRKISWIQQRTKQTYSHDFPTIDSNRYHRLLHTPQLCLQHQVMLHEHVNELLREILTDPWVTVGHMGNSWIQQRTKQT
jgi:Txe/YoeB family toxin of Txe-Axe toxin-antitoxin module